MIKRYKSYHSTILRLTSTDIEMYKKRLFNSLYKNMNEDDHFWNFKQCLNVGYI